jgi:hypothetical protein
MSYKELKTNNLDVNTINNSTYPPSSSGTLVVADFTSATNFNMAAGTIVLVNNVPTDSGGPINITLTLPSPSGCTGQTISIASIQPTLSWSNSSSTIDLVTTGAASVIAYPNNDGGGSPVNSLVLFGNPQYGTQNFIPSATSYISTGSLWIPLTYRNNDI